MTLDSIAKGTGGVLTDFSDAFFKAVTGGLPAIIAMFLPFIIFIFLIYKKFDYSVSEEKRTSALIFVFADIVLKLTICKVKNYSLNDVHDLFKGLHGKIFKSRVEILAARADIGAGQTQK